MPSWLMWASGDAILVLPLNPLSEDTSNKKVRKPRVKNVTLKLRRGKPSPAKREGAKSGVGRLERMKSGSGIKGRDDKSSGIEILMAEAFAKIKNKIFFFYIDSVIHAVAV